MEYRNLPLREQNLFTSPIWEWDFLTNEARIIRAAMFNWYVLEEGIPNYDEGEEFKI